MTGFPVSLTGCRHPILFFGSGGYYVICSMCSFMWVARDPINKEDAPDPNFSERMTGLNNEDKRVDPNFPLDQLS
jgi:hypothetical protein